jgi:hypothetical protein
MPPVDEVVSPVVVVVLNPSDIVNKETEEGRYCCSIGAVISGDTNEREMFIEAKDEA